MTDDIRLNQSKRKAVKDAWKATAKQNQEVSDAVKLSEWVKTLPYGSMISHHVAGDIGLDK